VTVVDQNGTLLSNADKMNGSNTLDPSQLKYVHDMQQSIVKRIESIVSPIVGTENVRAEATADVDFSRSEQAAEVYKPNQTPNSGAVRSQQSSESQSPAGANATGVPGSLTNQPPGISAAPLNAPATNNQANTSTATNPNSNAQKEMTVNYEVDKTIRYVQQPMGGLKRLSVAVVVNYKRETDAKGKVTLKPLSENEKTQITNLVKEAMGFNADRGDTLNVVNSPFAAAEKEIIPEVPFWKNPHTLSIVKEVGKYTLGTAMLLYLFFGVLKPMFSQFKEELIRAAAPPPQEEEEEEEDEEPESIPQPSAPGYQQNLNAARELARSDPKVVANVVKTWVGVGNE
jgi:flagellar M-ring protein FliF